MKDYPTHCQRCGLYKNCKTWNIPGRGSKPADVLIVGQGPGRQEDREGKAFVGPSGVFLQRFLDRLECSYYLCNATRCFPGVESTGSDRRPSPDQIEACRVYLDSEIKSVRPKVIVCLGEVAMRSVLGDTAPKTLSEAKKKVYKYEDIHVISNYHPSMHITGKADLLDSYIAMFTYVEGLISGKSSSTSFSYTLHVTHNAGCQAVRNAGEVICIDVETAVNKANPTRRTLHHENAKLLTLSFTYLDSKTNEYITHVLAENALTPEIVQELLTNRTVVGHNIKYDLVAIWALLGFNPYLYIRGLPHDTFLASYLQNQSRTGNGLKVLAQKHFFAGDWDSEVWQEVDQKNEMLRRARSAAKRAHRKALKENPEAKLEEHVEPLADFEDVPLSKLAKYNAHDTYYTARLWYEIFNGQGLPGTPYRLCQRMTRTLSYLEMEGLPVNISKLRGLQAAVKKKYKVIEDKLLSLPEVKAVIETGHTAEEVIYDPIPFNDKSYKFLESLAARLGDHNGDRTESGRLAFGKETLIALGRANEEDVERTRSQWIWYYLYKYRQLKHLADVFLEKMFIPYVQRGKLRTTYKLGKAEIGVRVSGADVSGGTETGRLSSSDPNLQNLKKDTLLRACFETPMENS